MSVLKLVRGSADSPVTDNLFIPRGTVAQTQGKSHWDSSVCCCRSMPMAHRAKCNSDCPPPSVAFQKMLPQLAAGARCSQLMLRALGMLMVIEAAFSFASDIQDSSLLKAFHWHVDMSDQVQLQEGRRSWDPRALVCSFASPSDCLLVSQLQTQDNKVSGHMQLPYQTFYISGKKGYMVFG